jgi:hypothetical protein
MVRSARKPLKVPEEAPHAPHSLNRPLWEEVASESLDGAIRFAPELRLKRVSNPMASEECCHRSDIDRTRPVTHRRAPRAGARAGPATGGRGRRGAAEPTRGTARSNGAGRGRRECVMVDRIARQTRGGRWSRAACERRGAERAAAARGRRGSRGRESGVDGRPPPSRARRRSTPGPRGPAHDDRRAGQRRGVALANGLS